MTASSGLPALDTDPPDPPTRSSGSVGQARLAELLRRPRYEVLALPGTADEVVGHVPVGRTITVTVSARRGLEATLALSEELAQAGYSAVPHLAARMIRDRVHLHEIISRLDAAGIDEVFVVGGDADSPAGDFTEAAQLLRAADGLRTVGVAAYPEGHPFIGDDELDRAVLAKQPWCSYAVTQMCFDAGAVEQWVRRARSLGFDRPVHAGVPGPVDALRLARIAGRIGVGPSLRYARKQRGSARLFRPGGYRPDQLLSDLAGLAGGDEPNITGLHIYTLGDIAATEHWRRQTLERLSNG